MEIKNLERELELKPGSVILEYGFSWIAKAIRFWMKVYRFILRYKRPYLNEREGRLYNHVAMFVLPRGYKNMQVGESIGKGYVIRPFTDTYYKKSNYIILDPVIPLSVEEQQIFSDECVKLTFKVTRYQFSNFLFQMILIITGKWYGRRDENRMYCSYSFANRFNKVRPDTFKHDYAVNPYDILIHPSFKVKDMKKYYEILNKYKQGLTQYIPNDYQIDVYKQYINDINKLNK